MPKNASYFSNILIAWYLHNKRSLPWRETKDPYHIWLSEIMLQQTRVAQGLPYYEKFVSAFPTVHNLAEASEDTVLKLWQGLGYYSRARNLHATAEYISNDRDGIFPNTYEELLKLKGVGDYTASAIASICFNLPTAVVDGNVYRVLARFFNIDTPINSSEGVKTFKKLAQELLDPNNPGEFNQAIMEFGARQCAPQNPACTTCVLNDKCLAFQKKKVKELPVKIRKNAVKKRYFNYLVFISDDQKTILQQRVKRGIWQQLFEFPLIETDTLISIAELRKNDHFKELTRTQDVLDINLYNNTPIIHKLSHRHLHTQFWILNIAPHPKGGIPIWKIQDYAGPGLICNFVSVSYTHQTLPTTPYV